MPPPPEPSRRDRLKSFEREFRIGELPLALLVLGLALSSETLAVLGGIGLALLAALHLWQRYSLDGLTYARHLEQTTANFGERVHLEYEIVNDKPLPLSYLKIDEEVPAGIPIDDSVSEAGLGGRRTFVQVLPLLPYERVRRRVTVVCSRRGEQRFGPAMVTSGDPLGRRSRSALMPATDRLLVYPKVFELSPVEIASRVLLGEVRTRRALVADPSRVAGVRAYEPGDPLRHVNWRASARAGELLVRRFEPTVNPSVAVLFDVLVPGATVLGTTSDEVEFAVAVAASLLAALAQRRVPVGLFSTGSVAGLPVAHLPSSADTAYRLAMESLARVIPHGQLSFERVLAAATTQMATNASLILVAGDFPPALLDAIATARRRHAVSAVFVETGAGRRPPASCFDALASATYFDDWPLATTLELSS